MKVLVTAGPIPARLDSVKFVTNRFKGGLAAKTAASLASSFDVEVVKWRYARLELPAGVAVRDVDDVLSYREAVLASDADAFVLAAGVANLMPVSPWEGKFPSHDYEPGEEFAIQFAISPRIIDEVKKVHPRSTLIGYKLFDGSEEELIRAGFHTMRDSRANVVFCNHPATAKSEKIALTADGARIGMTFDEHVDFIRRAVQLEWYRTYVVRTGIVRDSAAYARMDRLLERVKKAAFTSGEISFGTLAMRAETGFITTTRGKRDRGVCQVFSVDPSSRTVTADAKATMNAPMLHRLFEEFPDARFVLHAHGKIPGLLPGMVHPYAFPGTTEEDRIPASRVLSVDHHGYYAVLDNEEHLDAWLRARHPQR